MPPVCTTVLFRKLTADSPAIGRIICAVTRGIEYHTEVITELGYFSSHDNSGVRFIDSLEHEDDAEYWDKIVVPAAWLPETLEWAKSIVGEPYTKTGAFLSGFDVAWRPAGEWWCSATSREIVDRNGFRGTPEMPNPHALRVALDALLGNQPQAEAPRVVFGDAEHDCLVQLMAQDKLTPAQVERIWEMGT